jgi:hypothetical protein
MEFDKEKMKNMGLTLFKVLLVAVSIYAIYYIVTKYSKKSGEGKMTQEHFYNQVEEEEEKKRMEEQNSMPTATAQAPQGSEGFENPSYNIEPAQAYGQNETYQMLSQGGNDSYSLQNNQYPKDCFPKDQLTPAELLPSDANSKWAQSVPSGQGELGDQNFLTAGYHIGVNTIGQTLRNANRQLRSEPLNPQVKVSPWLQTTIEPDMNRRPLEIGGCN